MTADPLATLSPLDEERFGIRTAKARVATPLDVERALAFCREAGARLLIVRCPSSAVAAAHAIEAANGRIMDVLVYQIFDLEKWALPSDDNPIRSRFASIEDTPTVTALARAVFKGYRGHYHADPRLDPDKCDEVYISWAERSCRSRDVADAVLLLVDGEAILAFVTLRMANAEDGEIVVGGVDPAAQARGMYRAFMIRSMAWCKARGARRVIVSTQVVNIAVQKAWHRLGFEPSHSELTFHIWLDEESR